MANGYVNRIVHVDMDSGSLTSEVPEPGMLEKFVGGYGLGARILLDHMPSGVDPLGSGNILGFVTGPLTGTEAQISSRFTVVAKSPLTRTWGDANSGGWFGPKMKQSGFDAIFFHGASRHPVIAILKDGDLALESADDLWGRDTFETEDILRERFGHEAEVACIGQAGELLSLISGIVCNKGRLAARSGLGAVMGSKKLKAVVALGNQPVEVWDPERVRTLKRDFIRTQSVFADLYKSTGTPGLVEGAALSGDMPTKNWHSTVPEEDYRLDQIDADAVMARQVKRWGCFKCSLACGGVMDSLSAGEGAGAAHSHKPEYETIASLGTLCMVDNLESIIKGNDLCNRFGLDSISAGATVAFAMDLFDRGMLGADETGLDLSWGNADSLLRLLEMMGLRRGFGDVLADGVLKASERIGKGSERYAVHIQGQELPMHDPRAAPGFAPGYHLDDTPARHMHNSGWAITAPPSWLEGIGVVLPNPSDYRGQGRNFMVLSAQSHFINALGVCMLGWLSNDASYMYEFTSAVTGWKVDKEAALRSGERIANVRHAFNLREGHNARSWSYPGVMIGNPPNQSGPLKGITLDMEVLEREWLEAYHWDPETTYPDPDRLRELGIPEIAGMLGL
jgi:aldehyde:ferredoxin oxidoreductase